MAAAAGVYLSGLFESPLMPGGRQIPSRVGWSIGLVGRLDLPAMGWNYSLAWAVCRMVDGRLIRRFGNGVEELFWSCWQVRFGETFGLLSQR